MSQIAPEHTRPELSRHKVAGPGPGTRARPIRHTARAIIDHPADSIDLAGWLSGMTDTQYQACSRAHRAAGTFRSADSFGMVNVESIGGHLLVQHYRAQKAEAGFVFMRSPDTRLYLYHIIPVTIEVHWILRVAPSSSTGAELTCTVETRMRGPLTLLARFGLLPFFLKRHVEEETRQFGADIARKLRIPPQATADPPPGGGATIAKSDG